MNLSGYYYYYYHKQLEVLFKTWSIFKIFVIVTLLSNTVTIICNAQPTLARGSSEISETSDDSDTSATGDADLSLLQPDTLDVVRLNERSIVLKWLIAGESIDNLKFFKVQYKSTKKPNDQWKTDPREISPTIKACQIDGLRPGNYLFVVVAVYDNNDSHSSIQFKYKLRADSKINTKDLPEQKPPKITWSEAESDLIRFKWTYPTKEKDITTGYYGYLVYYRSTYQVSEFLIYNTLDESVEIAELEYETIYEAKVLAYNEFGVSEFSELLIIKTKSKPDTVAGVDIPLETTPSSNSTTLSTTPIPYIPKITTTTTTIATTTTTTTTTATPIPMTTIKSEQTTTTPPITYPHDRQNSKINNPSYTGTSTIIFEYITSEFSIKNILSWNDTAVIRYALILIVSMVFIVCLMNCHRRRSNKKKPATQSDLEINGFFKNSFPSSNPYSTTASYCRSCVETA